MAVRAGAGVDHPGLAGAAARPAPRRPRAVCSQFGLGHGAVTATVGRHGTVGRARVRHAPVPTSSSGPSSGRSPASRQPGAAPGPPAPGPRLAGLHGGRATATQPLTGLPTITLVTMGARTGQRRHTPLIAIPARRQHRRDRLQLRQRRTTPAGCTTCAPPPRSRSSTAAARWRPPPAASAVSPPSRGVGRRRRARMPGTAPVPPAGRPDARSRSGCSPPATREAGWAHDPPARADATARPTWAGPQRVVVVTQDGMGVAPHSEDEEAPTNPADLVEQPAKVMRIGSMIKQLLEEVRNAPARRGRARPARRDPPPLDRGAQGRPRPRADRGARADRPAVRRARPPPTPSCGSRRPSSSGGWRASSTASRPRCSPSRWPPRPSSPRCAGPCRPATPAPREQPSSVTATCPACPAGPGHEGDRPTGQYL